MGWEESERKRSFIFWFILQMPTHNSQGWASLRSGAKKSIWASQEGRGMLVPEPSPAAFQGCAFTRSWRCSWFSNPGTHTVRGSRCHQQQLNHCTNTHPQARPLYYICAAFKRLRLKINHVTVWSLGFSFFLITTSLVDFDIVMDKSLCQACDIWDNFFLWFSLKLYGI